MSSAKIFLVSLAFVTLISGNPVEAGKNYQVFDVRRNLAMNSKDAVTRDYYVNAGTQDGLKTGMILSVYRRDPIFDAYDDIRDDLYAPVGQIRLIHVQRTLSIARLVAISKNTTSPIVDFRSVMIGDRIDLKSATMGEGGIEDLENSDREGTSQTGTAGGGNTAAKTPTPSDAETTPTAPTRPPTKTDKPSKPDAIVSQNAPQDMAEAPSKDAKTDTKKVPDGGSLFTEENKPSLNTQ
ncbi:MAG: hypothetical protein K2X47_16935 [Bdellovibrionales bacterium]|nr:hypothetical protein [Bdellovibrionales bacterium]